MSEENSWPITQPNGPGAGYRVGPAWLGDEPWSDATAEHARLIAVAPAVAAALRRIVTGKTSGPWLTLRVSTEDYAAACAILDRISTCTRKAGKEG